MSQFQQHGQSLMEPPGIVPLIGECMNLSYVAHRAHHDVSILGLGYESGVLAGNVEELLRDRSYARGAPAQS
jgi:hypothetical protein